MTRELKSGDCQAKCDWHPTGDQIDSLDVFACSSCGQEWISSEGWTPRNMDGKMTPEVAAARAAAQAQTITGVGEEPSGTSAGGNSVGSW